MTDDERLEAAAEACEDMCYRLGYDDFPQAESFKHALRPHLPPGRDALVEALREMMVEWRRLGARCTDGAAEYCADDVAALLARHAPEASDA